MSFPDYFLLLNPNSKMTQVSVIFSPLSDFDDLVSQTFSILASPSGSLSQIYNVEVPFQAATRFLSSLTASLTGRSFALISGTVSFF